VSPDKAAIRLRWQGLWFPGPGGKLGQMPVWACTFPARANATQRPARRPAEIQRLGHVALGTTRFRAALDWHLDTLGLIVSDFLYLDGQRERGPAMAFIRCDLGSVPADHHTLAMALMPQTGYLHSAYEVTDLDEVAASGEYLREHGYRHAWGLGRHIQGSQIFDYWRDPDRAMFEHYTDGDVFDATMEPGWAPLSRSGLSQWGPKATAEFTGANDPRVVVAAIKALRDKGNEIDLRAARADQGDGLMSARIARTAEGWWAVTPAGLVRLDLPATTTAGLLADRAALTAAVEAAQATAAAAPRDAVPADSVDLLSPVTAPARVVAQAVNYRSHAIDSGFDPDAVPPAFFRKASHSITGPVGDIIRPDGVGFLDYEIELGLVIGTDLAVGSTVTDADLARYVAALVVADDVSARQIQLVKTQFYESKSYPTFTPVGPWLTLVDAADLARLDSLRLTLSVNEQVRQDSTTADMIVRPARALTLLSRFQPMTPGDLLLTGTPGGTALKAPAKIAGTLAALLPPATRCKLFFGRQAANPRYLHDGDVIIATIASPDGQLDLGTQHNTVIGKTP
jgi:2-keto-4-pentenoate hydratase/2-oxohepta-3-ene-1,7-dioic acid hydratase in catechol pathway/catechol 2,3-dioxygenase-like lactoylglutathione lyase family enzyme